jgi:hypothetical protein
MGVQWFSFLLSKAQLALKASGWSSYFDQLRELPAFLSARWTSRNLQDVASAHDSSQGCCSHLHAVGKTEA